MKKNNIGWLMFGFTSLLFIIVNMAVSAQDNNKQEKNMVITGDFEVQLSPQMEDEVDAGRMVISKIYRGGLDGSGKGQMLSKRTETEGSAGYVAIEEFRGSLEGKKGSFTLLHRGLMNRGTPSSEVVVVPDSGTGELKGISGTMKIIISEGKHSYKFEYTLSSEK